MVEFSDFECPFCSKAAAKIEAIQQAYPKDLRLIYKQYPLSSHPDAKWPPKPRLPRSSGQVLAHARQLFANSKPLSRETIDTIAQGDWSRHGEVPAD